MMISGLGGRGEKREGGKEKKRRNKRESEKVDICYFDGSFLRFPF